jgi:hypothetical protein
VPSAIGDSVVLPLPPIRRGHGTPPSSAYPLPVIERVRLVRYKGFEDFTRRLGPNSVLVGPNNSGKTTLVQALRLSAGLLRYARRRNVGGGFNDAVLDDHPRWVQGHAFAGVGARELSWYTDENLRYEFRDEPTGLEVAFKSGARLRSVWPAGDGAAFFYIEQSAGLVARTPAAVRGVHSKRWCRADTCSGRASRVRVVTDTMCGRALGRGSRAVTFVISCTT